jgi:hypothetical protein
MLPRYCHWIAPAIGFFCLAPAFAQWGSLGRSVLDWPTGVTLYKPAKCFNGFTVITPYRSDQAFLIDMAGRVVHTWNADPETHAEAWFFERLPNGHWFTMTQAPQPDADNSEAAGNSAVAELDWKGQVVWRYAAPAGLHLHHDMERTAAGHTLILASKRRTAPRVSRQPILDVAVIEVDAARNIVWQWSMSDHFDEFGFSDEVRQAIHERGGDVFHTNTLEVLPENELAARDKRFIPGNLLLCNRSNSLIFVVDRATGKIVWKWGLEGRGLVGPHHPTMLRNGDILIYDNGGSAPFPPRQRSYTRLVEVAPLTGEIVWQYTHEPYSFKETSKFFSSSWGSVQRLPNGNTVSLDCHKGRVFEITPQGEIVWEYISPFSWGRGTGVVDSGIYRVYRYAYEDFPAANPFFAGTDGHLGYLPAALTLPPRLGLPPRR